MAGGLRNFQYPRFISLRLNTKQSLFGFLHVQGVNTEFIIMMRFGRQGLEMVILYVITIYTS